TGNPEWDAALSERTRLIEDRALEVLARARETGHAWAQGEGREAVTVAAYRDRWAIDPADPRPLGGPPGRDYTQRADHARAARALRRTHHFTIASAHPDAAESPQPPTARGASPTM